MQSIVHPRAECGSGVAVGKWKGGTLAEETNSLCEFETTTKNLVEIFFAFVFRKTGLSCVRSHSLVSGLGHAVIPVSCATAAGRCLLPPGGRGRKAERGLIADCTLWTLVIVGLLMASLLSQRRPPQVKLAAGKEVRPVIPCTRLLAWPLTTS